MKWPERVTLARRGGDELEYVEGPVGEIGWDPGGGAVGLGFGAALKKPLF